MLYRNATFLQCDSVSGILFFLLRFFMQLGPAVTIAQSATQMDNSNSAILLVWGSD